MSSEPPELPHPPTQPPYPNQPQQMPDHQYQPTQQSSRRHESYTIFDDLRYHFLRFEDETNLKIALVVNGIAAFLLATVCLVPYLFAAQTADNTSHGLATLPTTTTLPTQPTAQSTTSPLPKPTGPQPLSGATLGGTRDSFTAKWGNAFGVSGVSWYIVKLADGTTADLCYCTEHTGSDGNSHLAYFHIDAPSGTTWSDQQGVTITRQFVPPDAKHVRDFTDPQIGLIHVYVSADLAATFPASEFKDSGNGQQLPPGTFSVACSQPGIASQCLVVTGD